MAWSVPVDLEEAVLAAARAVVGEGALATGPLAKAIVDRSRRYTSEREALSAPTDRTADLAARAAFFTIADAMKIAVPLAELARCNAIPARRPLRVVDLGAGCGALSLGLIAQLFGDASGASGVSGAASGASGAASNVSGDASGVSGAASGVSEVSGEASGASGATSGVSGATSGVSEVSGGASGASGATSGASGAASGVSGAASSVSGDASGASGAASGASGAASGVSGAASGDLAITAIDRDAGALKIAAQAIASFARGRGVQVELTTRTGDVVGAQLPACDVVVIGSVLNELAPDDQLRVVDRALAAVGEDGAVIAIEPALRETTRALHVVRDRMIARGAHVFAPCTRHVAPCPALADPDDWCHEDRALGLPPRTAELARITHLRDSGMKFAYLVLRRRALDLAGDPDAWRVVAEPRAAKGKLEVLGCSRSGWATLRLLKRHKSTQNRGFDEARRGDVLVVETGEPAVEASPSERIEVLASTTITRVATAPES